MANWIVALDADEDRRRAFIARVASCIAPVAGLSIASHHLQQWSVAWACATTAPVDSEITPSGAALVWGEPRDAAGVAQTAASIRSAWHGGAVSQWDGFYAAAVVDAEGTDLIVGTDLLGVFPVYYWTGAEGVVLVATSLELFRTHPLFDPQLNETGLIGILLTNGLVDGQTLWRGVRRLAPGCRLRVATGRVWEERAYSIPCSDSASHLPLAAHASQLAQVLRAAIRRHVPGGRKYALLLSGGLDSRLLGGCLADQNADITALTFGRPDDVEMKCARAVAASLNFPHQSFEVAAQDYGPAAERLARWEALAAGFGAVTEWATQAPIAGLADRVVTGHMMDGLVGGLYQDWAYDGRSGRMGFDTLSANIATWGFDAPALRALLQPDLAERVDEVLARLRDTYAACAQREDHRAWIFSLHHRARLHVGSAIWITSFAAWPVIPFFSRDVIGIAAGMPCSSLAGRRVQCEILTQYFPALAQLPLDRNSDDTRPLSPRLRHHLAHALRSESRRLQDRLRQVLRRPGTEHLYYRRIFDPNSAGWRAVRARAEPHRSKIPSVLRPEVVRSHLPLPEEIVDAHGPIPQMSRMRMLLGLALWAGHGPQA